MKKHPRIRTYKRADIVENEDTVKERIKFVYLCDICKYKRRMYTYRGNTYAINRYGVGILTENNYYYYNEIIVSPKRMTQTTLKRLTSFFTARYKFTERSLICTSKSLENRFEPIVQYLHVVSSAIGTTIHRTTQNRMLEVMNTQYPTVKIGKYSKWKSKKMIQTLKDRGMFVFMPAGWEEKMQLSNDRSQKSMMECAIGIIYMDMRRADKDAYQRYLEKVENGLPIRRYKSKEEREEEKRMKDEEKALNAEIYQMGRDRILGNVEKINLFRMWETGSPYNNPMTKEQRGLK